MLIKRSFQRAAAVAAWLVLPPAHGVWAADAPPTASIRLLAFSRVGAEMQVAVTDPDGKLLAKEPLALPTQQLSPSQSLTARSLVFTAPQNPKKILGKVVLPASGREFVLIFLPAKTDASIPYKVDAVLLPDAEFGSGDYAFVNYSGQNVGCVIDGAKLHVPRGGSAIYHMKTSGKGVGNRSIVCYNQKDGKWETTPFLSSRIIIQEGVRNLILICLDPRTGRIDFRGLPDFVATRK